MQKLKTFEEWTKQMTTEVLHVSKKIIVKNASQKLVQTCNKMTNIRES